MVAFAGDEEEPGLDDIDFDDEDFENLPCSWNYATVCILMPLLNGQLHALLFPGYTLHFEENGWPLVRAGLAVTIGFLSSVLVQQVVVRNGYWLIVPLTMVHLAVAILAVIFTNSEWAIFLQIACVFGIDPTCAIEGIAFDAFGDSEIQSKQASSTALSVYTIAVALSCTIGGIVYDFLGWQGVAMYHSACQGLLVLSLCIHPACRNSFKEVFFPSLEEEEESDEENKEGVFTAVIPEQKETVKEELPTQNANLEGVLKSVGESYEEMLRSIQEEEEVDPKAQRTSKASEKMEDEKPEALPAELQAQVTASTSQENLEGAEKLQNDAQNVENDAEKAEKVENVARPTVLNVARPSAVASRAGLRGSFAGSPNRRGSARASRASFARQPQLRGSFAGRQSRMSAASRFSRASRTSMMSSFSRVGAFSEAGQDFRHHFGTSNVLQPQIAGATGAKAVQRDGWPGSDDEENFDGTARPSNKSKLTKSSTKSLAIPKDTRFPAMLIVMNSAYNNAAYVIEYATFAIYFKQVHNWNEATLASITQTAGDVMAAIMVQLLPLLLSRFDADPEDAGCLRRWWTNVMSLPYNVSVSLVTWVLFNFGMMSPYLPLALTAQILMGTTFVYSSKWSTEMNLFYSLGDSQTFLGMQVMCRNAEAIGGGLGGLLATWLYTFDPLLPFAFTGSLACIIFVVYTSGFCARLGFGDDMETAEAKRARRKGLRRVSTWKSQRKTQVQAWTEE